MPKGIPNAGFRKTKNWKKRPGLTGSRAATQKLVAEIEPDTGETDAQIGARLAERFEILATLTEAAMTGDARALVVSGPAGLGKSYTIEQALTAWDPSALNHTIIKGYVKTTGLYRTLYQFREEGQVIVFDDADSIFFDDVSLNMLKAVCDTTERRVVSYLAEWNATDDEGEDIPRSFEFAGTIVFITNLDFDALIEKNHRLTPHLQAMVSRAHYIDLTMKTRRDHLVRIKQVLKAGMLRERGVTAAQERDVVAFIEENIDRMRELSLRMALKVGTLRKMDRPNWKNMAIATCCRNA